MPQSSFRLVKTLTKAEIHSRPYFRAQQTLVEHAAEFRGRECRVAFRPELDVYELWVRKLPYAAPRCDIWVIPPCPASTT